MREYKYILDENNNLVPEPDLYKWALWLENPKNRILKQQTGFFGLLFISTVFLGIDHSFMENQPPILYETMVFPTNKLAHLLSHGHELYQNRYSTREQALQGHEQCTRFSFLWKLFIKSLAGIR